MNKSKPRYNEIIFTESQQQEILDMYLNQKISSVKIGQHFGCSHKPILKVLKAHNVDRTGVGRRKYNLDEFYFDTIDSHNKAYIFGFLCADGSNCRDKATVSMALQEGDKQILEDIRKELKSEKELEFLDYSNKHDFGYTYQNQWRLNLFSSHICDSLNALGMMPNKSLRFVFPKIEEVYYSDFLRGYFDGNGAIYKSGCSITSTFDFCYYVQDILKNLGIESLVNEASNHNGITAELRIPKKENTKKFLDYIYSDSEMHLERKYLKYISLYC